MVICVKESIGIESLRQLTNSKMKRLKEIRLILSSLFFCLSFTLIGQVPTTNIYLFDYRQGEQKPVLLNPRLLTDSNSDGYNNQPKFFGNDLYFTRQLAGDTQTDIVILDIDNDLSKRFTSTRQSEYSPTPMPDGEHLSCIRVEDDGVQVLWQYPLDRSHAGRRIFEHVRDIGYHHWISDNEAVMFIVGSPIKGIIASTEHDQISQLTEKIGRCFGNLPDGRMVFVYKYTEDIWHLKAYDHLTKRSKYITTTLAGSEDFVVLDDGSILMARASQIHRYMSGQSGWEVISNLNSLGISSITRMAFQDGQLVIVGN